MSRVPHDPELCGLDDGGPSSHCPGCRAECQTTDGLDAEPRVQQGKGYIIIDGGFLGEESRTKPSQEQSTEPSSDGEAVPRAESPPPESKPNRKPRSSGKANGEAGNSEKRKKEKKSSTASVIVNLAQAAGVKLFHTPDQTPFAELIVDTHRETHPVRSTLFRGWLSRL